MSKHNETAASGAVPTVQDPPKRNLQRLRIAAGYRSAKEFAEAVGIPAPTYSRYEQGDGARIPLRRAWIIADALGTSIDAVAGRASIDVQEEPTLQARYDALSASAREQLDGYLAFLESGSEGSR